MDGRRLNSCGSSVEVLRDLLPLTSRRYGQDAIVEVRGELDLATAPLLERALAELVDDQSYRSIVIDLHSLDYMGSMGLSVLLNAQNRAQNRGGEVILARPSPAASRTIELAGLQSAFTIHGAATPIERVGTEASDLEVVPSTEDPIEAGEGLSLDLDDASERPLGADHGAQQRRLGADGSGDRDQRTAAGLDLFDGDDRTGQVTVALARHQVPGPQRDGLGGVPLFVVTSRRDGAEVIVVLVGEFDLNGVGMVEAEVGRALGDPGVLAVGLDLAGLSFIDSSGLRAVLDAWQRVQDADMAFRLVSVSEEAIRTARLAGLDGLLDLADP